MHMDDLVGKSLNEFRIEERIGRGGMATVYRAFQPGVNRDVALKVIRVTPDNEDSATFRQRFAHEAELIASLEHLHILPIYAYGIVGDNAYIAMRLLRGGSIAEQLRRGALPLDRAVKLFNQIAGGLDYAHKHGVIHRDLKPSNILLDDAGNAYLTDFGLAKMVEGNSEFTKTGNIVGTPSYMSPEQLRGEALDHRSDIYSLGVILYQMVTGRQPFESSGGDVVSVIYKHLEEAPPPPTEHNPQLPASVEEVILTALSKKPSERFDSAQEMADELSTTASIPGTALTTTSRRSTLKRKRDQRTRRRWLIGAAVTGMGVVLLMLAMLVIAALQGANRTYAPPNVQTGEVVTLETVMPTEDEIRIARERTTNSFLAYMACTQDTAYHAGQAREVADLMTGFGIRTQLYDADTDSYTQVTQLDQARAAGAMGLFICPLDATLLEDPLLSAQNARIPLVMFTGSPPSYGGVLLAGDDYTMGLRAGRFTGQYIRDELDGEANVVILDYPDLPQIVLRADGIEDGIREFAPDANIVGRYLGGTPDLGRESVQTLLDDDTEFNVIVSINDAGAFGAIEALEAANIAPEAVMIVGVDAEPRAQEYIREGYYFRGSVEISRTQFSRAAAYAMIKLLSGSAIAETILVPPGEVVTAETLALQEAAPTAEATPP